MAYVYRHIRLDKNEVFYIGIGSDTPYYKRAGERARRSKFWKKVIAKTEWVSEILFDNITWEEAIEKEKEFISLYGRKNLHTGTLVNLTDGGEGIINLVFSEEHKKNLSKSMVGRICSDEQKEKLRKYRLGIPNSAEARKKISIANKGKKKPQHAIDLLKLRVGDKNPMFGKRGIESGNFKGYIEAYKDGVLIGVYEGVHKCAEELNVAATKVSAVLLGRRNKTGGYTFKRNETIINGKVH